MTLRLGRISGVAVNISYSWLLILGLFTYSVSAGYVHRTYPWLSSGVHWLLGALLIGIFIVSLLVHEWMHAYVASRVGVSVAGVDLFLFGSVAKTRSEPDGPRQELLVAASAPALSLVAAGAFWLTSRAATSGSAVGSALEWFAVANAFIAGVNLLPAFPLDGGRMLRAVIWSGTNNHKHATRIASTVGQAIGWALIGLGIVAFARLGYLSGLWIGFFGWFLSRSASRFYRETAYRQALSGLGVEGIVTHHVEAVEPSTRLDSLVQEYFLETYSDAYPVADETGIKGIVTVRSMRGIPSSSWGSIAVASVMTPMDEAMTVDMREDAWQAVEKMEANHLDYMIVMDSGSVAGLVGREDLERSLKARAELEV